jgi:hypothetical protein
VEKRNEKKIDKICEILLEYGDLDKAIIRSKLLIDQFKEQGITSPVKMKPAKKI